MGYSFDIELDTEQPFIVELEMAEYNTQTISGAIALKLDRAEQFKVATIAVHGHSKKRKRKRKSDLISSCVQVFDYLQS